MNNPASFLQTAVPRTAILHGHVIAEIAVFILPAKLLLLFLLRKNFLYFYPKGPGLFLQLGLDCIDLFELGQDLLLERFWRDDVRFLPLEEAR